MGVSVDEVKALIFNSSFSSYISVAPIAGVILPSSKERPGTFVVALKVKECEVLQ